MIQWAEGRSETRDGERLRRIWGWAGEERDRGGGGCQWGAIRERVDPLDGKGRKTTWWLGSFRVVNGSTTWGSGPKRLEEVVLG